jgi:hypothetical protein
VKKARKKVKNGLEEGAAPNRKCDSLVFGSRQTIENEIKENVKQIRLDDATGSEKKGRVHCQRIESCRDTPKKPPEEVQTKQKSK